MILGYSMVKKYDDMLSRFRPACYGQTEGRMDGHNIARQQQYADAQ